MGATHIAMLPALFQSFSRLMRLEATITFLEHHLQLWMSHRQTFVHTSHPGTGWTEGTSPTASYMGITPGSVAISPCKSEDFNHDRTTAIVSPKWELPKENYNEYSFRLWRSPVFNCTIFEIFNQHQISFTITYLLVRNGFRIQFDPGLSVPTIDSSGWLIPGSFRSIHLFEYLRELEYQLYFQSQNRPYLIVGYLTIKNQQSQHQWCFISHINSLTLSKSTLVNSKLFSKLKLFRKHLYVRILSQ